MTERKTALDRRLRQAASDYAAYVRTDALFACQKPADALANADELAFQVVHQVEELWMKLAAHTLIDIEQDLRAKSATPAILRRFARVGELLNLMCDQIGILGSMSPAAYAEIRAGLGRGSGQDSPGYGALLEQAGALWPAFESVWLRQSGQSLRDVYVNGDSAAFAVAEALIELDIGLARFRHAHLQLVDRMIGLDSLSLKNKPAASLSAGVDRRLFGELWALRGTFGLASGYDSPARPPGNKPLSAA